MSITPESRVTQFRFENFAVLGNKLYCNTCSKVLNEYKDVSAIEKHIKGIKHSKFKRNISNIQKQIGGYSKDELILDFIRMMTSCNIPLERTDNMLPFIQKHVINGGQIPLSAHLRETYLPKFIKSQNEELIKYLDNKEIGLIVDETKDSCHRNVVNTIAVILETGENLLIDVAFLDNVNAATVYANTIRIITELNIKKKNIISLTTDSAPYMRLYAKMMIEWSNKIIYLRCWAHLADLITDKWKDSPIMVHVNRLYSDVQYIFSISPSLEINYLNYLREAKINYIY